MRTLDSWAHRLLEVPMLIECPSMQVIGYDGEEPLFTGPGHISIKSRTQMEFVMHGKPSDAGKALQRLTRALQDPYANLDQLRVLAVDYEDVEWNCGWVDVRVGEIAKNTWRLSGNIKVIMTSVSGQTVHPESGVEVIYDTRLNVPIPLMKREVGVDGDGSSHSLSGARKTNQHLVEVEGNTIAFRYSLGHEQLWVTTAGSHTFLHPYIENWLGEPLNLLLGQLVYPRLIARNRGDGTAIVSLRVTPEHTADSSISSLLSQGRLVGCNRFWELYGLILTMIVRARNDDGQPNFEVHQLTHYYQEIAQATTGSNWVLCMTLASVVEGITKLIFKADKRVPNENDQMDEWEKSIKNMEMHVGQWKGDVRLRQRLMSSLHAAKEKGVRQLLKGLQETGDIGKEHLNAWQAVRNEVMHGNLVSPWLTAELEQKLNLLADLAHRLSETYIRNCAGPVESK